MKMTATEKVMEYVNRLKELENKLTDMGHNISDTEKRRTLLRSLRPEFDVTVEVICVTGKSVAEAISQIIVVEATARD